MHDGFGTTCTYDYRATGTIDRFFLLTVVLGDFILPLIIICGCYILIWAAYRKHKQQCGPILRVSKCKCDSKSCHKGRVNYVESIELKSGESQGSTETRYHCHFLRSGVRLLRRRFKSTEFKIARTVLIAIIAYCVAWTPYAIVCMLAQYGNYREEDHGFARIIPVYLAKMSTSYNPIIYGFTHTGFKQGLSLMSQRMFKSRASTNTTIA